jgi:hypothetical protein
MGNLSLSGRVSGVPRSFWCSWVFVVGKVFHCGGSLLLMLMKEDEGKQGFVAANRQYFYTNFDFASTPLFAASLKILINPGFNNQDLTK